MAAFISLDNRPGVMWVGKFIGGLLGWAIGGPLGGLIGVFIGHQFDKGLAGFVQPMSAEQQHHVQELFFQTAFQLLGHLAKADGRISEKEVAHTESLMSNMGLSSDHRREAITLFKRGASSAFCIDTVMREFTEGCGRNISLKRQLLNYLISLAIADGDLHQQEETVLRSVARHLGFSAAMFDHFIAMIKAQSHFKGYQSTGGQYQSSYQAGKVAKDELETAYAALGVTKDNSDAQIKKAYRKLMSENHPDKLMGKGVPEDMIKLATERVQEIQTAYDLIVASRKL